MKALTVFLLTLSLLVGAAPAAAQAGQAGAGRHVIVCVDGVGFSTIEKLRAEGHFRNFRAPARMISPFPTLTNLAMTDILEPAGAHETPGYEDNYFDAGKNKMRGGILDRLRGDRFVRGTFRELFDYHPSALKSGLGYAAPPVSTYLEALSDLLRLRQKARKSRGPVFFAYTGATDSLAHLGGEAMLRSFLRKLDDSLEDLARESRKPLTVTVFSDHGNHFRKYRRARLKEAVKRAGFRVEKRVRDDRSVVFPQFGLIGCATLFTLEENEERLAEASASVEGVDFASYEKGGVVHVVGPGGRATIERREGRYRYRAASGDPLGMAAAARELTAAGKADPEGFIADREWLAATLDSERPDAVRRVYEGTTDGVANTANVVVSFSDGYYTGSSTLDLFAVLQATHGNLGREQSSGFVMSTGLDLPAAVRAEDVWEVIGAPQLRKSAVVAHAHGPSPASR